MSEQTPPRKRRVVLCMGPYCNQSGQAEPFYERLTQLLGERGPSWASSSNLPVKWEIANCVSMCGAGPNLVIYPEDVMVHHLDIATLERIVQELLRESGSDAP